MSLYINEIEWQQAMGLARQSCARVFADGGSPAQAMAVFGLAAEDAAGFDWSKAITRIAETLCSHPTRKAA